MGGDGSSFESLALAVKGGAKSDMTALFFLLAAHVDFWRMEMPCERTEAMTGLSTCCAKSGAAGVSMPDMVPGCCLGTRPGDASPGSYKGCIVDLARN